MSSSDFFSLLKLRGSVGNPGNQNFSAYQAFSTYKFNGWMTNIFGTGVILNALGNTGLSWQETTNYDLGMDLTFWGERINATFDYYWKYTDPLLAVITTPGSMGVTSVAMNAGSQKTRGWEATHRVSPVYRPSEGIMWNISLNATSSRSEYADIGNSFSALNESGKASLVGTTRYYDGGSPTAIWAVRSAGIDPATGKELFIKKDGTYSFTYDVNDEVVVGDIQPKVEGLLGTSLYFKGLSIGCYLRYRWAGRCSIHHCSRRWRISEPRRYTIIRIRGLFMTDGPRITGRHISKVFPLFRGLRSPRALSWMTILWSASPSISDMNSRTGSCAG